MKNVKNAVDANTNVIAAINEDRIYGTIKFGLNNLTDAKLAEKAELIVASMTANESFLNPPVKMEDITAQIAKARAFTIACVNGGKKATVDKDAQYLVLFKMLKKTAYYVGMEADDVISVILSAGYEVYAAKKSTVNKAVNKVNNVKQRENEKQGAATFTWDAVNGSRAYQLRLRKVEKDAPYEYPKNTTAAKAVIDGLELKVEYSVEIAAIGTRGKTGPWSDPLNIIIT